MTTLLAGMALAPPKTCECCGAGVSSAHRNPLCGACAAPGDCRTYCASCGSRGVYAPEQLAELMRKYHPEIPMVGGIAIRLPACARCSDDGASLPEESMRFYRIDFD